MVLRKTVLLHRHPDYFPPLSEFYADLFVRLNSFLMVVFAVNSIFRSWMGDTSPLVPVQTLFNLCVAKLLCSVDFSTKFTLNSVNESYGIDPFDMEMRGGSRGCSQ